MTRSGIGLNELLGRGDDDDGLEQDAESRASRCDAWWHGLPALALAPAIGLSLVVSYLTYQSDAAKTPDGDFADKMARACAYAFLLPLFALGIGWVVHQFM